MSEARNPRQVCSEIIAVSDWLRVVHFLLYPGTGSPILSLPVTDVCELAPAKPGQTKGNT